MSGDWFFKSVIRSVSELRHWQSRQIIVAVERYFHAVKLDSGPCSLVSVYVATCFFQHRQQLNEPKIFQTDKTLETATHIINNIRSGYMNKAQFKSKSTRTIDCVKRL